MTNAPTTLDGACRALWLATLSLMTAFMHQQAPAHRYLLARRIAGNLSTLKDQECFNQDSRDIFSRLSLHWSDRARELAPQHDTTHGGFGIGAYLKAL